MGGWVGPKDDCLLASLRLDPFCDTTSTLFSPNLTVGDRQGSVHDFRAQGRCSTVAKIVGNNYCTETSVQPATVEVREYSICVCS